MSLFSILFALIGLSFLVFIHELGHYIMARRVGMRVEVFSIGIGRALFSWKVRGVKWQIGIFPFGGFVKVAGMDTEDGKDPRKIKDGYFGKGPWARIKVALMGPVVNIVFALLVFSALWSLGGRLKPFETYTQIIGWVDPSSELAQLGVKSGDTVTQYNGEPFHGFKDLLHGGLVQSDKYSIAGEKINYATGEKTPYHYNLKPYPDARFGGEIQTVGIESPASYTIFHQFLSSEGELSPLYGSGISEGDRIIWANGETIFSTMQLHHIVNLDRVLLTIKRAGKTLQVRIPRVFLGDLQLTEQQEGEFLDWKRELNMKKSLSDIPFIPYQLSDQGVVMGEIPYIDNDLIEEEAPNIYIAGGVDEPLEQGDKVLAVYGEKVSSAMELFSLLKTPKILIMVKPPVSGEVLSWKDQDVKFEEGIEAFNLKQVAQSIGVDNAAVTKSGLKLLKPITPITVESFYKQIGGVKALEFNKRAKSNVAFQSSLKYITLGSSLSDKMVAYNPNPVSEMVALVKETWRTLSSLLTGSISPKWLSGPVGMVRVMHEGWKIGFKEALYWMGLISLNLGLINLLPIPVLDGGHICFALWEVITRKPIKVKTMEKMVLPFVIFLIMVFIYTTYHDLSRLFFH